MSKIKIIKAKETNCSILKGILDTFSDEAFLTADGFDAAVIGVDLESMRLIYSVKKIINILSEQFSSEMSPEDMHESPDTMAIEYFEYNIRGSKGDNYPIWCEDNF